MSRINRMLNELTEAKDSATLNRSVSPFSNLSAAPARQSLTVIHLLILIMFIALALGFGWLLGRSSSADISHAAQSFLTSNDPYHNATPYNNGMRTAVTPPVQMQNQQTQVLFNPQTGQYVVVPLSALVANQYSSAQLPSTTNLQQDQNLPSKNSIAEPAKKVEPIMTVSATSNNELDGTQPTTTLQGQSNDLIDGILDLPSISQSNSESNKAKASVTSVSLSPKQLATLEYKKALAALDDSNAPLAIEHFQEALRYNPKYDDATKRLATLLYASGQTMNAVSILQRSITANPNNIELKLTLAKLLDNDGKPLAALNILRDNPKAFNTEYIAMRAALAQQLEQNMIAYDSYKQLVSKEGFDGRWWLGLAIASDRLNYKDEALTSYNKALSVGQISSGSQVFVKKRIQTLTSGEAAGTGEK